MLPATGSLGWFSIQNHAVWELLYHREPACAAEFGIIQRLREISNHPAMWWRNNQHQRGKGVLCREDDGTLRGDIRDVTHHFAPRQFIFQGFESLLLIRNLVGIARDFVPLHLLAIKVERGVERKRPLSSQNPHLRESCCGDEGSGWITGAFHGVNGSFYTIGDVTILLLADEGS